ncbi:glycoside hydrolase family 47 protein [Flavobacterium selenitireducens]|uniref:glycoside hydrolase family 47 protein n=1 Tax=Flavobacterium selenitireducens TaxID=2722704 RepID=UPI00168B74AD|nr:glycoside hydrolase family 47 protein [Flavobacterium selenitireducens]MBD3581728.1 glycoside hydrolase [Flavobacterium selenitireducens]
MTKLFICASLLMLLSACAKSDKKVEPTDKIESGLDNAISQYASLAKRLPEGRFPKSYHVKNDSLETSDSGWWCSGFYPGTLLLLDEAKGAPKLKKEAMRILKDLEKEQFNKTTHDLGFMMFCSFGNLERLDPNPETEKILMNSAKSLATRFNEKAGCIQSWDSSPWNGAAADEMPVIIDNMMNLELLFWATRHSGDSSFYKIATRHADTTIKNHFRPDYSSFHVVIYGKEDGKVHKQITNQGAADNSAWARGQAWGLYGYVAAYRETKDKRYLDQAVHIADFILNHPNFPKDKVPYWDFNAPGIPNALRDSSAASIIASALFELSTFSDATNAKRYKDNASAILDTLLSSEYLAKDGSNGGFLLRHGVGNMPNKTEIDVPLTYGDYYLVEAMMRSKKR